jgi:hypothetical protein
MPDLRQKSRPPGGCANDLGGFARAQRVFLPSGKNLPRSLPEMGHLRNSGGRDAAVIAKTFFLTKEIRAIRTKSLRQKKSLRDHGGAPACPM